MKITIAVCDDNSIHAEETAGLIKANCPHGEEAEIECFFRPMALLDAMREDGYAPQAAFLDIEMGELDGIELAKKITEMLPECRIIFVTSYINYAPAVYDAEHVWFLHKDTAGKYMENALRKVFDSLSAPGMDNISVHSKGSYHTVPVSQIMYLERKGHSTHIILNTGESITVSAHPDVILNSHTDCFIQCHQSFWVKIDSIAELNREDFILSDGTRLPIGRTYRKTARERFFEHYVRSGITGT